MHSTLALALAYMYMYKTYILIYTDLLLNNFQQIYTMSYTYIYHRKYYTMYDTIYCIIVITCVGVAISHVHVSQEVSIYMYDSLLITCV